MSSTFLQVSPLLAGKYIYIESSAPRVLGDKAKLVTSVFPAGNRCLQFYYHMKGVGIGNLTVYIQEQGQSAYPEFTKSGQVGDDWNMGLVQINTRKPYQVLAAAKDEAKQGNGIHRISKLTAWCD
mgnify:CR=1 FL=1